MTTTLIWELVYTELKTEDKLKADASNFLTWKRKLEFLLGEIMANYVLTDPQPPKPEPDDSPQDVVDAYNNWIYYDNLCCNIILDTVDEDLLSTLKHVSTAKSYLDALEAKSKPNAVQKVQLLRSFLSSRMSEKSSINCHITKVEAELVRLEMAGVNMPDDMKIVVLLESLPVSWKESVNALIVGSNVEKGLIFDEVIERLRYVGEMRAVGDKKNHENSLLVALLIAAVILVVFVVTVLVIW